MPVNLPGSVASDPLQVEPVDEIVQLRANADEIRQNA